MWLKCDICERTFGFRRTLIGHVAQVHSDEKPFICEFSGCTWSFALKKGLQKHTAAVHEGKKHVNHPKKKINMQGKLIKQICNVLLTFFPAYTFKI